jgi:hypothetical protein
LSAWDKSVDAWENALSSLPSEQNLTPAQIVLKAQYEAGLKTAQDGKAQPPPTDKIIELASSPEGIAMMPWIRALAMEKELVEKRDSNSSVRILFFDTFGFSHSCPPLGLGDHECV